MSKAALRAASMPADPAVDALSLLPPKFRDRASLKIDEVCECVLLTQAGLYKQISESEWPAPLKIGKRSFWPTTVVANELKRRLEKATEKQRARAEAKAATP